jgi:hypothetical protein
LAAAAAAVVVVVVVVVVVEVVEVCFDICFELFSLVMSAGEVLYGRIRGLNYTGGGGGERRWQWLN